MGQSRQDRGIFTAGQDGQCLGACQRGRGAFRDALHATERELEHDGADRTSARGADELAGRQAARLLRQGFVQHGIGEEGQVEARVHACK